MKIRNAMHVITLAALVSGTAAFAGTEIGNAAPSGAGVESGTSAVPANEAPTEADGLLVGTWVTPNPHAPAPAGGAVVELGVPSSPLSSVLAGAVLGLKAAGAVASTRYDVRYRPRRGNSWSRRAPDASSVSQVHLGWWDQDGDLKPQFLAGVRGGPMLSPNFQLGAGVDWAHKSSTTSTITRRTTGPGGIPIEVREDLAEVSTHFVPIYAFAQVQGDDDMGVIPYFGGSVGYQLLFLHQDDFQTSSSFDATFGGWGWQAWGGAAIPLSGRTRLTGEVYVNGAELNRDVDDLFSGATVRETVDADGFGARFGVAWGF